MQGHNSNSFWDTPFTAPFRANFQNQQQLLGHVPAPFAPMRAGMALHPEAAQHQQTHDPVHAIPKQHVFHQPPSFPMKNQARDRLLTLGEGSTHDAQIIVRGVDGSVLAALHGAQIAHPQKTVAIRGRQHIGSIEVLVPGAAPGMCDLRQAAGWLGQADHLQVDVTVSKDGRALCGLANRGSADTFPDRAASTPGTRCMYVDGAVHCGVDPSATLLSRRS
jgi:hypothetical protein